MSADPKLPERLRWTDPRRSPFGVLSDGDVESSTSRIFLIESIPDFVPEADLPTGSLRGDRSFGSNSSLSVLSSRRLLAKSKVRLNEVCLSLSCDFGLESLNVSAVRFSLETLELSRDDRIGGVPVLFIADETSFTHSLEERPRKDVRSASCLDRPLLDRCTDTRVNS